MTFRDWIAEKTPKTLHDVFGYREGTIRMWSSRNIIPRGVWPELMSEGMATLKELIAMERAADQ